MKGSNATVTVENGAAFATAGEVNNNIDILTGGTLAAWNAIQGNTTLSVSGIDTVNGNVTNGGTLLLGAANNSVGNNFIINGDYTGSSGSQIVMNSSRAKITHQPTTSPLRAAASVSPGQCE